MAALITIAFFFIVMLAISYVGYRHYTRPARYYDQLGSAAVPVGVLEGQSAAGEPIYLRVIRQVGEKVPISPQDLSMTRRYLMAAGFRSDAGVKIFYGVKVLACIAMLFVGLSVSDSITDQFVLRVLIVVALTASGFWGPNFILEELVSRRQERLKLALPDALDLMVVCVEAGLGLDQAILVVSRELELTHPDISVEFGLVNLEMQAGKRRADALRNLADRTGEAELQKLIAILIQTDRFGTSMADSLRTHSDFLRVKRKQEAEERAAKVTIKLIFPIFFFILPTMFIITAGPSVLKIFKEFFPLLHQMQGQ